jgi:hypothetical protein
MVKIDVHFLIGTIRQTNSGGSRWIELPHGRYRLPAENFDIGFGRCWLDVRSTQDNQSGNPLPRIKPRQSAERRGDSDVLWQPALKLPQEAL